MNYLKHNVISYDGKQVSIYIMREDGKSFCRVYYWFATKKYGCLDSLSVHKFIRKQGEGTRLQRMREAILKRLGVRYASLWVKKGSWMEEWYKRRGYKYLEKHKSFKGCLWYRKKL